MKRINIEFIVPETVDFRLRDLIQILNSTEYHFVGVDGEFYRADYDGIFGENPGVLVKTEDVSEQYDN